MSRRRRATLCVAGLLLLAGACVALIAAPTTNDQPRPIHVIRIEGAIDPPTATYVVRAINDAVKADAQCLIMEIDTPGGLVTSMQRIAKALMADRIVTVAYISPAGAWGASAGTIITICCNVAAMAPGATIGAAHPVAAGGGTPPTREPSPTDSGKKEQPRETAPEMEKAVNFLAEQARGYAEQRKRNAVWAEKAVRQSVTATAEKALKLKVIDLVAESRQDLLAQLDGRKVKLGKRTVTLHTKGAPVKDVPMIPLERFLHLLANPELAYILLGIATMGIILEFQNPGATFPGIIGAICLIIALYALSILTINVAGLALIVLAFALFVADVLIPGHGALSVGGIVAFLLGSFMLVGNPEKSVGLRVAWPVVVAVTIVVGGFFIFIVSTGIRAQFARVTTGQEGLIGARGVARSRIDPEGTVLVQGELWRARVQGPGIEEGDAVEVLALDEGMVWVRRADRSPPVL
jgi:membrane-bound serine protease (ClpP class)